MGVAGRGDAGRAGVRARSHVSSCSLLRYAAPRHATTSAPLSCCQNLGAARRPDYNDAVSNCHTVHRIATPTPLPRHGEVLPRTSALVLPSATARGAGELVGPALGLPELCAKSPRPTYYQSEKF